MVAFFIQHKCDDAFKYEALIQVNLTQSQKTEKTFFIYRPKFAVDSNSTQICGGL